MYDVLCTTVRTLSFIFYGCGLRTAVFSCRPGVWRLFFVQLVRNTAQHTSTHTCTMYIVLCTVHRSSTSYHYNVCLQVCVCTHRDAHVTRSTHAHTCCARTHIYVRCTSTMYYICTSTMHCVHRSSTMCTSYLHACMYE